MAFPGLEYMITSCVLFLRELPKTSWAKIVKVAKMARKLAQDDPRKVFHSFKVGLAIVLVSIFYNFRPSFYGFGDNTTWAVITVVVVMEFSVGATLGKGLNRMLATLLAGSLGVATHRVATLCGEKGQIVLISLSIFVAAGTVTFMRFFPEMKARYDYGMLIFILTFSLVSVTGYGENELLEEACERLLTIIFGSILAITICICICPVWIGKDLHNLVSSNIEKLAQFFQGFGDDYFDDSKNNTVVVVDKSFLQGYKSVLNSKTTEENMANLARWEPCHGNFKFGHPWKQYLKIGALTRACAYKIEALNVYTNSEQTTPNELRIKIQESCRNVSSECGKALKESSLSVRNMIMSTGPNPHVANAKNAAESLKFILRTNPWEGADLLQITQAAGVASLLIDVVGSIEKICQAIDELASLAKFKKIETTEPTQLLHRGMVQPIPRDDGSDHVITMAE
ncbi:hypothetical protein L6164_018902 [Bauhinia variegata]|uniref:Uncharacterized protein n=1 Tax=Bauhinia variegata TaxID=167791 RepID=A0ACB9NCH7_BAUVA|nr:hypothetical protein L6164_018902 [Bauhinia variegata]